MPTHDRQWAVRQIECKRKTAGEAKGARLCRDDDLKRRSDCSGAISIRVKWVLVFDKAADASYHRRCCNYPSANMVPKTFQAGYANTAGFRKVVKATIYIKKKDGMSDEDFIEYYNNNHAQRAVPILQRHGIVSYSLVGSSLLSSFP